MATPGDMSDAELAWRSAAGDREAFAEFLRRYGGGLVALIRRLVDDPHEAEDVLQEVLLQAWAGMGDLRRPGKVRQWLLQIARNRCMDAHRARRRRPRQAEPEEWSECMTRRGRDARRKDEARAQAVEALASVPEPHRSAADMFYLRGLTIAEIARRAGCPEGTVKRRLFDARRHMRRAAGVPERESTKRRRRQ